MELSNENPTNGELYIMIQNIEEKVDKLTTTVENFIECADKKYSPMAAWSVIKWIGITIGGVLIVSATYVMWGDGLIK
jgi:tetrahydromethanopterin S-methyltransferase subunit B